MVEYSLKKLLKLPHLSEFRIDEIFTKLGVYEDVVIDTFDLESNTRFDYKDNMEYHQLIAGKDVRMLEILKFSKEPFMIPCSKCQKEQSFKDINSNYSSSQDIKGKILLPINNSKGSTKILCEYNKDQFDDACIDESYEENYLIPSQHKCKSGVLEFNKKFSREYVCPLEQSHRVYGDFVIEEIVLREDPPKEVKEYKENVEKAKLNNTDIPEKDYVVKEYYEKLKKVEGYIIIKKIGQYPSMADMQFFECKKYSKILKDNYRDYTMALGLNASGVGCGSFLYLRRILELMVEEFHQECLSQGGWNDEEFGWNDEEFKKLRFNEKIRKIESVGKCVFPSELNEISSSLYGVLSRGVHESTEDECKELFPYVKYAIDIMLNEKIAKKQKADKLQELQKKLQEMQKKEHN